MLLPTLPKHSSLKAIIGLKCNSYIAEIVLNAQEFGANNVHEFISHVSKVH